LEPFVVESVPLGVDDGEPVTAGVAVAVEPRPVPDADPRRAEARRRRRAGESFRGIANGLGVGVGTVPRWLA
jgi:hypothetical protein